MCQYERERAQRASDSKQACRERRRAAASDGIAIAVRLSLFHEREHTGPNESDDEDAPPKNCPAKSLERDGPGPWPDKDGEAERRSIILISAQRLCRIDAAGAARGNPTGERRHHQEHERCSGD